MKRNNLLLFLIGLGSLTQVSFIGMIGISELIFFFAAPLVFLQDIAVLKRDGVMPVIWLSILVIISCAISCYVNDTALAFTLRGLATCYSVFAGVVMFHRLLRLNIGGLKWYLLGVAISGLITVFAFRSGTQLYEIGQSDMNSTDALMQNQLFWIAQLGPWLSLPIRGWFFQTPIAYIIAEPILFAAFCLLTSTSGRSSTLALTMAVFILFIGRKDVRKMASVGRHFLVFSCAMIVLLFALKSVYQYTASNGILGEEARAKYEKQTRGKKGVLALIMGGRSEFFIGLIASLRAPVWGYGPWPIDSTGIAEEFLEKYGDDSDVERYFRDKAEAKRTGRYVEGGIPAHSHIIGAWVYYGFAGFVFWLYILYRIVRFVRYDFSTIPCLYGYFALSIPSQLWNIFFSPFGNRIVMCSFIVCLLLAEAARKGRIPLSPDCFPKDDPRRFHIRWCRK